MSRPIAAGMSFHLHTRSERAAERRQEEDDALKVAEAVLAEAQCPVHSRGAIPVVPVAPHIAELTLGFQCSGPNEVPALEDKVRAALGDRVTSHWRTD